MKFAYRVPLFISISHDRDIMVRQNVARAQCSIRAASSAFSRLAELVRAEWHPNGKYCYVHNDDLVGFTRAKLHDAYWALSSAHTYTQRAAMNIQDFMHRRVREGKAVLPVHNEFFTLDAALLDAGHVLRQVRPCLPYIARTEGDVTSGDRSFGRYAFRKMLRVRRTLRYSQGIADACYTSLRADMPPDGRRSAAGIGDLS